MHRWYLPKVNALFIFLKNPEENVTGNENGYTENVTGNEIVTASKPTKPKSQPMAISGRVSAYRDRLVMSSYHRVDVAMPDEKRHRIEKIAAEANGSYAETVSALAQMGLEEMERMVLQDKAEVRPLVPQFFAAQIEGGLSGAHNYGSFDASARGSVLQSQLADLRTAKQKSFLTGTAESNAGGSVAATKLDTFSTTNSSPTSGTSAVDALSAFFRKQKAKND